MIVGILGSGSSDSLTRKGMQEVATQVRAAGLEFDLIDLRSDFRELQDIEEYSEPAADSQTVALRKRIAQASGIVLATPVYHGGGPRSASVACDQLRSVVRALSGWSTPMHVGMTYGDVSDSGPSEDLRKRIAGMVAELKSFPGRRG